MIDPYDQTSRYYDHHLLAYLTLWTMHLCLICAPLAALVGAILVLR